MTEQSLAEFVTEATRELGETVHSEDFSSATCREAANVASAMLAIGRVNDAKQWFANAAQQQAESAVTVNEAKLDIATDKNGAHDVDDLGWGHFVHAALFAGPTASPEIYEEVGDILYSAGTDATLDELDGREKRSRPYLVAAFGALYLRRDDVPRYCQASRGRLDHRPAGGTKVYHRMLIDLIDAIADGEPQRVTNAIETYLQEYHMEHVVGNDEGFHFAIQAVSLEATAFTALARTRGIGVEIDSEYVPDAIYDEEHYPLGGD